MGVVGSVDENALTRYCVTWVRWRQAIQLIEKGGSVQIYKDETGKVKTIQPSAFHSIARSLADELSRLEQAFGLTPSARSRIEVTAAPAIAPEAKDRFFTPLKIANG
jgi:P27 family predicted phage terminase small subunit